MADRADLLMMFLLILFIPVIVILDFTRPALLPTWVTFTPLLIPVFASLDVVP